MKIKNESQRTFCFNGGCVAPGKVVDVLDKAVANALIKGYPGELVCLDTLEVEVIPAVEEKAEVAEEAVEGKKTKSRRKK